VRNTTNTDVAKSIFVVVENKVDPPVWAIRVDSF